MAKLAPQRADIRALARLKRIPDLDVEGGGPAQHYPDILHCRRLITGGSDDDRVNARRQVHRVPAPPTRYGELFSGVCGHFGPLDRAAAGYHTADRPQRPGSNIRTFLPSAATAASGQRIAQQGERHN